jgi:hypothetical protein
MTASTQADRPLQWIDFDKAAILFANHFLVQHQLNEFVLTLGQVTGPPPVVGAPDEVAGRARDLGPSQIHTIGRVGLSRHRLVELIELLQVTLQEHDRTFGAP